MPTSAPALQGALLAFQRGSSPTGRREGRPTPATSRAPSREPSQGRLAPRRTNQRDVSPARSDVSGGTRRTSPGRAADSLIAANLATGRGVSPVRTGSDGPDRESIRGTTNLISMFEGTEAGGSVRRVPERAKTPTPREGGGPSGDPVKVDTPRVVRSRASTPVGTSDEERVKPRTSSHKPVLKPKPSVDAAVLAARQVSAAQPSSRREAPAPQPARGARPPTPPKPRGAKARATSPAPSTSAAARRRAPTPDAPPARRESGSSEDTFVSASSVQSPPPSPPRATRAPRPSSLSPPRRPVPPPRRTPGATLDPRALSSAMVAGSVASSRLTPSHTGDAPARTQPSPRILQTLRTGDDKHHKHHKHHKDEAEREEEHRHRHRHRHGIRGPRHRHGKTGKKWAGRISESQRKRYEALWASNRGLLSEHLPGIADPSNYVVNTVVRELWRRSRLPDDELEEVWALVDVEGKGVLGRREFVVGTWLVDQRLRGRKIPARIGDGVWDSASGVMVRR